MKNAGRHPAAIAWDQWIESEEGRGCWKPYNFLTNSGGQYLENRLALAFQAGWRAAEKENALMERPNETTG